jgi:hypothetical protein
METTAEEKERLNTIVLRLVAGDDAWLREQAIDVGQNDAFWILNYADQPRTEYNRFVRGMVVAKPAPHWSGEGLSLIRSFPFIRFFNRGEEDADPVDLRNAEMLEKLDGAMLGVFFPHGDPAQPHWHTRRLISHPAPANSAKLLRIAGAQVRQLRFDDGDACYTFIFELVHLTTRVITKYRPEQDGLYLIGARNLQSHRELNEAQLDEVAQRLGARRPRRWDAVASEQEILHLFQQMSQDTPDFEGFVFRDKATGRRVKVKDPAYVQAAHLGGVASYKNLLPRVLAGEGPEILAYFPSLRTRVQEIQTKYDAYAARLAQALRAWRGRDADRKTVALELFGPQGEPDPFIRAAVMKTLTHSAEGAESEAHRLLRELAFGRNGQPAQPKRLAELLGLNDLDDDA